tara:strand:+ start:122 stop:385 length:264 start_codon:yes stop_codon:yes gene_type:complete
MVRPERESSTYTQYSIASRPRITDEPPSTVPPKGKLMSFGKLRPQIFLAIFCLTLLAIIAVFKGSPEISTATIGGIIALGMKILEAE